jgi:hypothetical protein
MVKDLSAKNRSNPYVIIYLRIHRHHHQCKYIMGPNAFHTSKKKKLW